MKKIILAAAALSLATVAFAPVAASAAPVRERASVGAVMIKRGPHCTVVKRKARIHGHWVVSTRRVCRR